MVRQQCMTLRNAQRRGDILSLELFYPRTSDDPSIIQIGLMDVRAADNIQISYDFKRDGYSIKQAAFVDEIVIDEMDWQEVAFIKAWGREKEKASRF